MIVYFSGTGNSRYAAELLAQRLEDELLDAGVWIKKENPSNCTLKSRGSLPPPLMGGSCPTFLRSLFKKLPFPAVRKPILS